MDLPAGVSGGTGRRPNRPNGLQVAQRRDQGLLTLGENASCEMISSPILKDRNDAYAVRGTAAVRGRLAPRTLYLRTGSPSVQITLIDQGAMERLGQSA